MKLHAITIGEGQRGFDGNLSGNDLGGAGEGFGDDEGLLFDLARVCEMLEIAAPAETVDRAGWRDPVAARLQYLEELGLGKVALSCHDARRHPLAGQGQRDENRLPAMKGEPRSPSDELIYAQLDGTRFRHGFMHVTSDSAPRSVAPRVFGASEDGFDHAHRARLALPGYVEGGAMIDARAQEGHAERK